MNHNENEPILTAADDPYARPSNDPSDYDECLASPDLCDEEPESLCEAWNCRKPICEKHTVVVRELNYCAACGERAKQREGQLAAFVNRDYLLGRLELEGVYA